MVGATGGDNHCGYRCDLVQIATALVEARASATYQKMCVISCVSLRQLADADI
jgi:hypothetical protein